MATNSILFFEIIEALLSTAIALVQRWMVNNKRGPPAIGLQGGKGTLSDLLLTSEQLSHISSCSQPIDLESKYRRHVGCSLRQDVSLNSGPRDRPVSWHRAHSKD